MMTSTTTEKTITELHKLFASFGLPEQVVSDNGSQFTSSEFDMFMKFNGIKHILTAPYHPKSNKEAKRAVQTFKNSLKAQKMEKGDVQTKLSRFLLCYRNTPNSTTGLTPAELFLKRKVRTRLDLLRPNVAERVSQKQASAKLNSDKKGQSQRLWVRRIHLRGKFSKTGTTKVDSRHYNRENGVSDVSYSSG